MTHPSTPDERRRRRSDDTITALHYQLAFVRAEAKLDAVVLVDGSGCLVAGAGAWPICEELAAYAPLLAHREAARNATVSSRVEAMAFDVDVRAVEVDGVEVLLCGRGGLDKKGDVLARAANGCRRILAA